MNTIQIHNIVKTEVEAHDYNDSALDTQPAGFIQIRFSEAAGGPVFGVTIHAMDVPATLVALMAKAESALYEWEHGEANKLADTFDQMEAREAESEERRNDARYASEEIRPWNDALNPQ